MNLLKRVTVASLILLLNACIVIDPNVAIEERSGQTTSKPETNTGGFPQPSTSPTPEAGPGPETNTAPAEEIVAIATPESVNRPQTAPSSSAAAVLRKQANSALKDGDFAMAERHIQRALRIAPREPENYAQLAAIRLEEDKTNEALQLARKGLTLKPNARTKRKLNDIIAITRQ